MYYPSYNKAIPSAMTKWSCKRDQVISILLKSRHLTGFTNWLMGLVGLVKKNVSPHSFPIAKYESCVSSKQNLPKYCWLRLTGLTNFMNSDLKYGSLYM